MPLELQLLSKDSAVTSAHEKEGLLPSDSDRDSDSFSTSMNSRRLSSTSTNSHSVQTSLSDIGSESAGGSEPIPGSSLPSESKAHSGLITSESATPTITSIMSAGDHLADALSVVVDARTSTSATLDSTTSQSAAGPTASNASAAGGETANVADIIQRFVNDQRRRDIESAALIQSLQEEKIEKQRRDQESAAVIQGLKDQISEQGESNRKSALIIESLRGEIFVLQSQVNVFSGQVAGLVGQLDTERKEKAAAAEAYEKDKAAAAELYEKDKATAAAAAAALAEAYEKDKAAAAKAYERAKAAALEAYENYKAEAAEERRQDKEQYIRQYAYILRELVMLKTWANSEDRHVLMAINGRTVTDNIMKFLAWLLKLPGLYKDLLNGSIVFRQWLEQDSTLPTHRQPTKQEEDDEDERRKNLLRSVLYPLLLSSHYKNRYDSSALDQLPHIKAASLIFDSPDAVDALTKAKCILREDGNFAAHNLVSLERFSEELLNDDIYIAEGSCRALKIFVDIFKFLPNQFPTMRPPTNSILWKKDESGNLVLVPSSTPPALLDVPSELSFAPSASSAAPSASSAMPSASSTAPSASSATPSAPSAAPSASSATPSAPSASTSHPPT